MSLGMEMVRSAGPFPVQLYRESGVQRKGDILL
jgi:hypothetical protein